MERSSLLRWLAEHDPLPVVPLVDPIVEELGHDARSRYAETFWLPVLGPASVVLLRRLADCLDESPEGFLLPLAPAAATIGLGHSGGCNAPLIRTLGRLVTFGIARVNGDGLAVRRCLPPLARRHIVRLPGYLAEQLRSETREESGEVRHLGPVTASHSVQIVSLGRSGKSIEGSPGGSGPWPLTARSAVHPVETM
jgi:hypothetical protein